MYKNGNISKSKLKLNIIKKRRCYHGTKIPGNDKISKSDAFVEDMDST